MTRRTTTQRLDRIEEKASSSPTTDPPEWVIDNYMRRLCYEVAAGLAWRYGWSGWLEHPIHMILSAVAFDKWPQTDGAVAVWLQRFEAESLGRITPAEIAAAWNEQVVPLLDDFDALETLLADFKAFQDAHSPTFWRRAVADFDRSKGDES